MKLMFKKKNQKKGQFFSRARKILCPIFDPFCARGLAARVTSFYSFLRERKFLKFLRKKFFSEKSALDFSEKKWPKIDRFLTQVLSKNWSFLTKIGQKSIWFWSIFQKNRPSPDSPFNQDLVFSPSGNQFLRSPWKGPSKSSFEGRVGPRIPLKFAV